MKKLICKKCSVEAKAVVLDSYEHLEGFPLKNVEAMECPKCHQFVFTEKQIEKIEKRTNVLKVHRFAFKRKTTISGRSLVINIPEDLVKHTHMKKGKGVKLFPIDDTRFLVEVG